MIVTVEYIDWTAPAANIAEWCNLPSQGVQKVTINNGGSVSFSDHSLYWLYKEKDYYVAGAGSVRYDPNPLNEVLLFEDGRQENRKIEFMPDLLHDQIKLGWWNGKKRLY